MAGEHTLETRLASWPASLGQGDALSIGMAAALMGEAGVELTRLRAENEALREGPARIKIEALTMGAPGRRTVARGLSHIARICIDAGVTEKLDELEARQLLGETK